MENSIKPKRTIAAVLNKKILVSAITFLLIGVLLGSFISYSTTPSSTLYLSGGIYPGAPSHTIWTDGPYYYAKDAYGKIAYSSTNASEVINSATQTSSMVTYIMGGTYSTDTPIYVNNGVLFGDGALTIFAPNYPVSTIDYTIYLNSNCHVYNFAIDGNTVSPPAVGIGATYGSSCSNNTIENVEIRQLRIGISFFGPYGINNVIRNNFIHDLTGVAPNGGNAIAVNAFYGDFNDTIITGNHIRDVGDSNSGVICLLGNPSGTSYIYRAIVSKNVIMGITDGNAIQLYFYCEQCQVTENIITNYAIYGIRVDGSNNNKIANNILTDEGTDQYDSRYGIYINTRNGVACSFNEVSGNQFYSLNTVRGNTQMAIIIEGSKNPVTAYVYGCSVIGNKIFQTFDTTGRAAIQANYTIKVDISYNYIYKPRTSGIQFLEQNNLARCTNNEVIQSGWSSGVIGHGIDCTDNNILIQNNFIAEIGQGGTINTCDGIHINGYGNRIDGNTVRSDDHNAKWLIEVEGGTTGHKNILTNNLVMVWGNSGNMTISGTYYSDGNLGYDVLP